MKTNERLKHFLKSRGIRQTAVAEGIGMKKTSFNAVLNGHAELRADTLEAVCNFIGVSPGYFFKFKVQDNETTTAS